MKSFITSKDDILHSKPDKKLNKTKKKEKLKPVETSLVFGFSTYRLLLNTGGVSSRSF